MLGVGMVHFYNVVLNWDVLLLGLLWLLSLQLGTAFLQSYFDFHKDNEEDNHSANTTDRFSRNSQLLIAYAFLAVVASLSVLVIRIVTDQAVYLLMAIIVIGSLSYSVPPLKLSSSGYGEFILSLLIANLTPALSYQLQGGDTLRLLAMVTFPLTALHLAMLLVFSLSTYASDIKYARRTMMLRMGWQNGMLFHNLLILVAYLLLVLAITFGLPLRIGAPALLTLPVGIYQIISINRIAAGGKPQWKTLSLMSVSLFCITAYLLTFSFWIR